MLMLIIAIAVIIFSVVICFMVTNKYYTVSKKYKALKNEINTKYVKNDAKLQNAACLAQEWAKEHNDVYEEHIFHDLLKELKGKR